MMLASSHLTTGSIAVIMGSFVLMMLIQALYDGWNHYVEHRWPGEHEPLDRSYRKRFGNKKKREDDGT